MHVEDTARLEHILNQMPIGAAILDCASLSVEFVNASALSFLPDHLKAQDIVGLPLDKVLPPDLFARALSQLQAACLSGQHLTFNDIPYEGFLEDRGRTYWHINLEPLPARPSLEAPITRKGRRLRTTKNDRSSTRMLLLIEDVTAQVRSRLHLKAIHFITSVLTDPYALHLVLDRVLLAVQEMVGSTRCAILLADNSHTNIDIDFQVPGLENAQSYHTPTTITVAAQIGLHSSNTTWKAPISEGILFGQVARSRRSLVLSDTSLTPLYDLPLVDNKGEAARPGSVLVVPIFEPGASHGGLDLQDPSQKGALLGTIEVYHRRPRNFPAEEVELLEQFALQVGLAIQNARMVRSMNQLARTARRSARRSENVMQAIPDGVIIFDSRWRIVEINDAIRQLMGWTNDVIGLYISSAFAVSRAQIPQGSQPIPETVADLERRAIAQHISEIKMVGANGRRYVMRRSQAAIRDELGDMFAFVMVYHDVTEQAEARERIEAEVIARTTELAQRNQALQWAKSDLEMESARIQLLLERLPSGVTLVDHEQQTIKLINAQAVQLLQRMGIRLEPRNNPSVAARRAVGLNIETLLRSIPMYRPSGALFPYEEQPLYRALHHGDAGETELFITPRSDHSPLYLLVNAAPVKSARGRIKDIVLVWHDISRMKILEQTRENFFHTMAHELKTPLANIRAHLSALQAPDLRWSPEEQTAALHTADEQVERLVRMINQFLDASRVEAGALRPELEPILLPELFEDLEERLEALIASSQRRLEISLKEDLPTVQADYEQIMSVLINLLSNAFRYAPVGDSVRLEASSVYNDLQEAIGVEICVIDRGPGLTLEQQAELFSRFHTFTVSRQGTEATPTRKRSGTRWSAATGLGLYISRGIIEAHSSILRLQSAPGEGAVFAFTLAIANASSTAQQIR